MASNSPFPYSPAARGEHKRSLSPYNGAEMGRVPSNGSHSSRWSGTTASPTASSPEQETPRSPGGGITNALGILNFSSVNEQRSDYDEQQDAHSTQYADTSHQFQSLPSSTQATVGSQSQETAWYQYYDFIANVDQGQAPYWQLKTAYTPSKEYPQIMPIQEANTTPLAGCCLESGCDSHKPFKRKADLERHYQQVHRPAAEKPSYPCDYSRCGRATDPFYRRDHSRDHYREYHREDIMRRSSSSSSKKQTAEWWGGRVISAKWWRCSKCLRRVYLQKDHFECRDCKATCEAERRKFRGYD